MSLTYPLTGPITGLLTRPVSAPAAAKAPIGFLAWDNDTEADVRLQWDAEDGTPQFLAWDH